MRVLPILSGVVLSLAALGYPTAQSFADDASEASKLDLSRNTLRRIERDPDKFLQRTIKRLYELSPDGVLTADTMTALRRFEVAEERSRQIGELMAADLDGDGIITAQEFVARDRVVPADKARAG